MSTTEKGNRLEDQLYDYLNEQLVSDGLIYGIYPAHLCKVHRKKKYYCNERKGDVEFDIVIEVRRDSSAEPHIRVVFECKNHQKPIQERDVTDFSDKIRRVFGHGAKGVVVCSSRLQSGAENFARSRKLGIVKFDANGTEIVADRRAVVLAESEFVERQIFESLRQTKPLKLSAYSDGSFYGSMSQLLQSFDAGVESVRDQVIGAPSDIVRFLPDADIREVASELLGGLRHQWGAVNLEELCASLELRLSFSERHFKDEQGNLILGSANFGKRTIEVNQNGSRHRERFTIAHEIGHFCLQHDRYLVSETIIERDLMVDVQSTQPSNFERLEFQANILASELLLPLSEFTTCVEALRQHLRIYDKGFGYIFVDDQRINYTLYSELLSALSSHFDVSKQAVEVRLKRLGLVNDERRETGPQAFRSRNSY
ncbi:ImmA/IrrE family metallo-endopeptidase [Sulfitobacter sp. W002]|uniref:ImmA/IrrE family metallo-endopeptidase n=1 Tax=Sulfitobacter sp. W002 TaxID=2867024 RepID=UPI0021A8CBE9|nr:ImmA/IrrE family metallo-endopeptidase [Sulfitobacter sp. W002]UWR29660.1 ImmA/IrrE family metallo-endopeptidase [Sulfitobacter sp. W002]